MANPLRICIALFVLALLLAAQNPGPVIKSGDNLAITTNFLDEKPTVVTVQSNGMIVVPILDRVRVEGLTLPRISAMLRAGFAQYIADPKVTVELVEKPR